MNSQKKVYTTVAVAALGYFVDIYDLLLFGIVRAPSLRSLGVPEDQMLDVGIRLLNMQMAGMLVGGVVWGIMGDLRGRKSVLFGSILLYSLANIANAVVPNPDVYAILRFVAGVGLAGELGAAITLVAEIMPKETRGFGTTIVASFGILGAVLASFVGDWLSWQAAYLVGGVMGLGLLLLRAGLLESQMFHSAKKVAISSRGLFHRLLIQPKMFVRYLSCIAIGVPIWFVIGVLITFAPELSRELGVEGEITGSRSIMWAYVGLSLGDLGAGLLSQWRRSRKQALLFFILVTAFLIGVYTQLPSVTSSTFYILCVALGWGSGYWATFVTVAAEQFGTNVRATVATSVPNFVRGSVVPITLAFQALRPTYGAVTSAQMVGSLCIVISLIGLWKLDETFHKDLDYLEVL